MGNISLLKVKSKNILDTLGIHNSQDYFANENNNLRLATGILGEIKGVPIILDESLEKDFEFIYD